MRLEFHVWGGDSDIKAGLGMMGSEWQAMDGAARQGKRKSKGGLWLWKTPGRSGGLQPGGRGKKRKNTGKIIDFS